MFFSDRLFIRKIFLLAGDFLLCFFSLFLALSVRQTKIVDWDYYLLNVHVFLPIFLISLVIYILFDLYSIRMLERIYRSVYFLFLAVILNTLLATAFLYLFYQNGALTPKTVLLLYATLLFLLTMVWRFLYYDLFFTNRKYQKKALLIGGDADDADLRKIATPPTGADYRPIGYIAEDERRTASPYPGVPFLGNIKQIHSIIQERKVEELIVAYDYKNNHELLRVLSDSLTLGVKIFEWQVFFEQVFQKVPTNQIDHFWFIYNFGETDKKLYERVKRLLDIIISAIGIFCLTLAMPFILVLIKTTAGPVFFRQKRMGFNGKIFTLIKFRTMEDNAEKSGAVWAAKNDKRVTKFGKFMRKTRIDELPQLFNIFWGEMSLVGPRPERPEFLPILEEKIPFYYKRHMVKPGITGFAQVMFPYASTVEDSLEKVGYDLFYIKNRSFYLYAKIFLLTLQTIIAMRGQ